MKIKWKSLALLSLLLIVLLTGCVGSEYDPNQYIISGLVHDQDGNGLAGVLLYFKSTSSNKDLGQATSLSDGTWTSPVLQGEVEILPISNNYYFKPSSKFINSKHSQPISFTAIPTENGDSEDPQIKPDFLVRKAEIEARYQEFIAQIAQPSKIYMDAPHLVNPYNAGTLNSTLINNGLHLTNFVRFLVSLNDDITVDLTWNNLAQHASLLNMVNNKLSHYPTRPADMPKDLYDLGAEGAKTSNLSWRWTSYNIKPNFESPILGCLADSAPNNLETVGHRRWLLNPAMTTVGFGLVSTENEYYAAMKVFGDNKNSIYNYNGHYDYIAWPSEVAFPTNFFATDHPWSVSLNHNIYDNNKLEDIKITLKNITSNKSWTFTKTDLNRDTSAEKYYNISTGGYGIPFCIIFRPDNATYNDGDIYDISIENIYRKNGSKTSISFVTQFFNLNDETINSAIYHGLVVD